jgi:hypothetical protein
VHLYLSFFTQRVFPFIQKAYTYIGKIDNGQTTYLVTIGISV